MMSSCLLPPATLTCTWIYSLIFLPLSISLSQLDIPGTNHALMLDKPQMDSPERFFLDAVIRSSALRPHVDVLHN